MIKLVIGILAHVDAGKTSLSESMLFLSGKIRRPGRVDNRDAYLDTNELEKLRGITIFSKQAIFTLDDTEITLLDTPGHVDFSAEMERTLQVLDFAILVISGADGIQGHTKTLWRLLRIYNLPVFIFVNKMDQNGTDPTALLKSLKTEFGDPCIVFEEPFQGDIYEQLALCDERTMEAYLEHGILSTDDIQQLVAERKVFPVYFGSALKQFGVEGLIRGLMTYTATPDYPETFGAKVYKISRDPQGNRLTHLKVTGGQLKVKDSIKTEYWEEKVNQIRLYSGERFDAVSSLEAGAVCAVTGLSMARPGEGFGAETASSAPILEPVLSYKVILPEGVDERVMLPKLRQLEEEEPALRLVWNEILKEIHVQMMGEVQIEILQALILARFDVSVTFGESQIVYKETISEPCEGVGHFEPLRHYAEVHLLLEPGERGSGLLFDSICSEDLLEKSWQKLVLTHLQEKIHAGVLTGSPITDIKITLVSGQAHTVHTDGGDFREATYRAVRQGLKTAKSVLLEPYYVFRLELPGSMVGKAMTVLDQMNGSCSITETDGDQTVLSGYAPVSAMQNFHKEVAAFTKGHGRLVTTLKGYDSCHNQEAVISRIGYDSERDVENPTGSVFCQQGAGFYVPWDQVKDHMHLESFLKPKQTPLSETGREVRSRVEDGWISLEEIDQIMNSTFYSNKGKKSTWKKRKTAQESYYDSLSAPTPIPTKREGEEYLLVDGYNIIFDWPELKALAEENLEAARIRLLDTLCNYQGIKNGRIIVVFDAYRVEGRREKAEDYHNISVVFTAEAQTADQYIEKFARVHRQKIRITVATSDGLQQVIIRGAGCDLLSARELKEEVDRELAQMEAEHLTPQKRKHSSLQDVLSEEEKALLRGDDKVTPDI